MGVRFLRYNFFNDTKEMCMEILIKTENLTKVYTSQIAVDHVNLNVKRGKIYGLLGRNGAGKTTLMRMILNLASPSSGNISLFGKEIKGNEKEIFFRIGSIIETPGFYENLTAEENLKLLTKIRGTHKKDDTAVSQALKFVGLDKEQKKVVGKYSLGMKQRLGIAAAVLHSPDLLILDEPINGLDPVGIHEIRNFFMELKAKGTTILISSHILSEIELIADTIGVMHEGKLIEEVSKEELHLRNRKYIEFEVSDENKVCLLLERNFPDIEFKITENKKLRIFNNFDDRGKINSILSKNDIEVSGIALAEEKLEDYFSGLIGGGIIG